MFTRLFLNPRFKNAFHSPYVALHVVSVITDPPVQLGGGVTNTIHHMKKNVKMYKLSIGRIRM
jgi:hypothetical protein